MNKEEYAQYLAKIRTEIKIEMNKSLNKILTALKPLLIDLKVRQLKSKHS